MPLAGIPSAHLVINARRLPPPSSAPRVETALAPACGGACSDRPKKSNKKSDGRNSDRHLSWASASATHKFTGAPRPLKCASTRSLTGAARIINFRRTPGTPVKCGADATAATAPRRIRKGAIFLPFFRSFSLSAALSLSFWRFAARALPEGTRTLVARLWAKRRSPRARMRQPELAAGGRTRCDESVSDAAANHNSGF